MNLKNIKCKNCEADIDVSAAVGNVVKCPYCGSTYALSNSSDEVQAALAFADGLLDVCEFDKAYSAFQKAAGLNPAEPAAHFGMALAAHKIQYLRDYRKDNGLQPICHDINDRKFSDDASYKKALSLSTPEQSADYARKAAEIDRIKSEFSALKAAGVDYDCFICVKVTDDDGRHTEDSHIAEKIYHSLKEAGYAPFYSEYDIRGQSGADYEARILYALFTSESMFLICTDERYLQTSWVKNEYTRFIGMMSEEKKERESLTVVFTDKPIERIAGLGGRIQGISINSFDALQRIINHVEAFREHAAPELKRKEYSGASIAKRQAVRVGIQKRNLAALGGSGEITVSDKSMLKNATAFLERGNFSAALNFADMLIKNNASNSAAYRLRFLAENECKTAEEYIERNTTTDFSSLENAIASADGEAQRKELYDMLFKHVFKTLDLDAYNEYVALPDSKQTDVATLTAQMYAYALNKTDTVIFDSAIKTISNTDDYIAKNSEFAYAVLQNRGVSAAKDYYKNVLAADESNGEALWYVFVADNGISDVFAFCGRQENFDLIESSLFAYGYNEYAAKPLFGACIASVQSFPSEACALADFLLSLIPKNQNAEFKSRLQECRAAFMTADKPNLAKRFNDRLLAIDKMDDVSHFNACLIKHGWSNPLSVLRLGADALNDAEFRAAFDVYPEKHPDKENPYLDIYTFITENADLMSIDSAFETAEANLRVDMFELKDCRNQTVELYEDKAQSLYHKALSKYGCANRSEIFQLTYDVSQDPVWREAYEFAKAYTDCTGDGFITHDIHSVIHSQAAVSTRNAENAEIEVALQKEYARIEEEKRQKYIRKCKRDNIKNVIAKIIKILIFGFIYLCGLSFPVTMFTAGIGTSFGAFFWSGLFKGNLLRMCLFLGINIGIPTFVFCIFGIIKTIGNRRTWTWSVSVVLSFTTAVLYIVSLALK